MARENVDVMSAFSLYDRRKFKNIVSLRVCPSMPLLDHWAEARFRQSPTSMRVISSELGLVICFVWVIKFDRLRQHDSNLTRLSSKFISIYIIPFDK